MNACETRAAPRDARAGRRFSLYLFFSGFAVFGAGLLLGRNGIGVAGFAAMIAGAVTLKTSLWERIANRRSAR